jgi:pantoate--beta-alanine ligase
MVPTMGALHAGHEALIARAAAENAVAVVTVFVNPTQFDDPADFARYPRGTERDIGIAAGAGAGIVFVPGVADVYPPGFGTAVEVADLAARWEGASRPGHFRGVATVVAILFGLVRPARAYFGEKDFQQLQVIRRLHADLALSGEVVGCATVREGDGLALASRNRRLDPAARETARAIPRALATMRGMVAAGEGDVAAVRAAGLQALAVPGLTVDYLAVVDPETLAPVETVSRGSRVLVAATVGGVRLIDNLDLTEGDVAWAS